MVVGGIQDWLIQNVVQQAILKIATMWNPVGALLQLIQTAWNAYQWLRENAQRIFGLVQAVVDSIANIVGRIERNDMLLEAPMARGGSDDAGGCSSITAGVPMIEQWMTSVRSQYRRALAASADGRSFQPSMRRCSSTRYAW